MRIVISTAEKEFASFTRALEQDASSWNDWLCLHIHIEPKQTYESYLSPMGFVIAELGTHLKETDGTAYVIGSHNIFILCRSTQKQTLRTIADDLSQALLSNHMIASSYHLYDVEKEAHHISAYCEDLGCWNFPQDTIKPIPPDLGEVAEMIDAKDIFEANIRYRGTRKPLTVMLVEDDPLTCRIVSHSLKDDYKLVTAHNAQEAAAQYAVHVPDIVFLDIGLPDHSGFDVMSAIIAYDPNAHLIMFSSNSFAENIMKSMHAGAKGFIGKPFRKERLEHYIQDYQNKKGQYSAISNKEC